MPTSAADRVSASAPPSGAPPTREPASDSSVRAAPLRSAFAAGRALPVAGTAIGVCAGVAQRPIDGALLEDEILLGEGDVDFPAVRQALLDAGFEGWCTVEQDCDPTLDPDPLNDARKNREYLESIGFK